MPNIYKAESKLEDNIMISFIHIRDMPTAKVGSAENAICNIACMRSQ